jgi:hypothetical protein
MGANKYRHELNGPANVGRVANFSHMTTPRKLYVLRVPTHHLGQLAYRPVIGFDTPMSPRVIQMPLSGGDRKHYVRELKRVEELHRGLVRKAAAAYATAEDYLRLAHYIACEEWNARQFLGGDADPSPQIWHAVAAGCTLLEARCPQCRTTRYVNLTEVIWPRDKSVHTLRGVLYCEPCRAASGRKLRPDLVALCMPAPTDHPPVAARAAKRT